MKKLLLIAVIISISGITLANDALKSTGSNKDRILTTNNSGPKQTSSFDVPSGAVIPFDLGGNCPSGWSKLDMAGRVIVGTGIFGNHTFNHREIGGNNELVISAENIKKGKTTMYGKTVKAQEDFQTPPQVLIADSSVYIKECLNDEKHCKRYPERDFSVSFGTENPKPVNNMQSYVALTYCKKN